LPDSYVIRLAEAGWEQEDTAFVVGPFATADAVAVALEAAGYTRSDPLEDPLTAFWGAGIEVCRLIEELPLRR
jgi:hypothetical protein